MKNTFLKYLSLCLVPDGKDAVSPLHRVSVRVFFFFSKNSNIQVLVEQ